MDSLQTNKIHKEEKRKILSDSKSKFKRERRKSSLSSKVSKQKKNISNDKLSQVKKNKTKIELFIEKQNDNIINNIWNHYKVKYKQRGYKNISQLARLVFADYVLLKKSDAKGICTCITCGNKKHRSDPLMHPGHFRTAGSSLKYRFIFDNVRPQDRACNVGLHGNYGKYTLFMIDTFNRERVDNILSDKSILKIKDWEYAEMIKEWWLEVELLMKSKKV